MIEYTKVKCSWCRTRFRRLTKEVNRIKQKGRNIYCKAECQAAYKRSLPSKGVSETHTRRLARKAFIRYHGREPICRICDTFPADVHHKDGDEFNNAKKNLDELCRSHHTALENKLHPKRKKVRRISVMK